MAYVQNGYIRCVVDNSPAPNRIRELREALGLSQAELARRAHVTPSALNKLELGTRGLDLDWMRRLAPLLDCTPADLLPRADNPHLLDDDERKLIDNYRSIPEGQREMVHHVADAVLGFRHQPREAA